MPTPSGFPLNIVDAIKTRFTASFNPTPGSEEYTILERPVRLADPELTLGIFVSDWSPVEQSHEIGRFLGEGNKEATLNRYNVFVENLVKGYDEEYLRKLFTYDAKIIRGLLYRDESLGVALRALSETLFGSTESIRTYGVSRQRFANLTMENVFHYIARTEVWFETQTT